MILLVENIKKLKIASYYYKFNEKTILEIFGIWFGVKVEYTVMSILKYLVMMILPLSLEYIIGISLRKAGYLLLGSLKTGAAFTLKSVPKIIKKSKNEKEKSAEMKKE